MKRLLISAVLACGAASGVQAAGGDVHLDRATVQLNNQASLQRGARLFVNYCMGCHSANFMLYSRVAQDLGLTEDQITEAFIFDPDQKVGEPMTTAMSDEGARRWFGAVPPDLSVISRSRGADWLYSFLRSFYADPSRPSGWNNTVFKDTSMPHVLWPLQGVQELEQPAEAATDDGHGGAASGPSFALATEGALNPRDYDAAINDLVTFLDYVGEPAKLKRGTIGMWVLLYLALFAFLAWLLKAEYWRDIH